MAPRSVLMLITVTDKGNISVDIRGPVNGQEGIMEILLAAETLVKQGTYRSKPLCQPTSVLTGTTTSSQSHEQSRGAVTVPAA